MGVYVKNMSMPKCCEECDFCDYEQGNCLANENRNTLPHDGKKKTWCPLVEVIEPHGALIDAYDLIEIFANRLMKVSERYGVDSAVAGAVSGAINLIYTQPIVIEADGE